MGKRLDWRESVLNEIQIWIIINFMFYFRVEFERSIFIVVIFKDCLQFFVTERVMVRWNDWKKRFGVVDW